MAIPRNRFTLATGVAAIMFAVTLVSGCGSDPAPGAQEAAPITPPAATQSSDLLASPIVPQTPTEPSPALTSASPTSPAQFNQLTVTLDYKKGRAPAVARRNGIIDAPTYVQDVMVSFRDIWRAGFAGSGVSMPRLTYDATYNGDSYKSACQQGGEPIIIQPEMTSMLYCKIDARPDGAIAIPLRAMAGIWAQPNQKQADLSVAISMTRQASLLITSGLERQLNLSAASDLGEQYTAACMSGAWGHAVYPQNAYSEKDLSVALERSFAVPTIGDGPTASLKGDQQAVTAWIIGYRSGDVAECGRQFWK